MEGVVSVKERNEKIRDFIEKYKDILKASGMDVAHSEFENRWFVFKYNPIFMPKYEFFIEVGSAEELANCILSELKFDMDNELEMEDVETPACEIRDISTMIEDVTV